jgi:hypothetical protein
VKRDSSNNNNNGSIIIITFIVIKISYTSPISYFAAFSFPLASFAGVPQGTFWSLATSIFENSIKDQDQPDLSDLTIFLVLL